VARSGMSADCPVVRLSHSGADHMDRATRTCTRSRSAADAHTMT